MSLSRVEQPVKRREKLPQPQRDKESAIRNQPPPKNGKLSGCPIPFGTTHIVCFSSLKHHAASLSLKAAQEEKRRTTALGSRLQDRPTLLVQGLFKNQQQLSFVIEDLEAVLMSFGGVLTSTWQLL